MNVLSRPLLRVLVVCLLFGLGAAVSGCRRTREREVVVYTSVDQAFSEAVFRDFEKTTGVKVHAVYAPEQSKDNDLAARLLAQPMHPAADVFWSGDPVHPFRLMQGGMVTPYGSPQAAGIPGAYKATDGAWTGLAASARVLLVNKSKVTAARMPSSIRALADPQWKGQTAIANPLYGTAAMHVAALFLAWGEPRAQAFLADLKSNGVRVARSNEEVSHLVVSGQVAFGLVDTDDAHEAMQEATHVAVVYPDQDGEGAVLLPTTVVLLRDGPHPDTARQLIDYIVSPEVEQHMAEQAARIAFHPGIPVPASIRSLSQIRAMRIDYARLTAEMERIGPQLRSWHGP
ncbi:MAG: extracellular solute-binding protein [Deltaproteobacteria bacterium]|nr:extracellular solute-binding protein [Deltaproteobacteria bacterium]